jgi:hypothetical protein
MADLAATQTNAETREHEHRQAHQLAGSGTLIIPALPAISTATNRESFDAAMSGMGNQGPQSHRAKHRHRFFGVETGRSAFMPPSGHPT